MTMINFPGKSSPRNWLSLASGAIEKKPKESPRLAAMKRLREKRAAAKAKARAAGSDPDIVHRPQEDHMPNKVIMGEAHQGYAPPVQAPPPPSNFVHTPPPSQTLSQMMRRRPTITLQLFPEASGVRSAHKSSVIGVKRAWVTRADGERMGGWLSWSSTVNDIVINCDCHNLMFNPEGFLTHAGLIGLYQRPLRHIWVEEYDL